MRLLAQDVLAWTLGHSRWNVLLLALAMGAANNITLKVGGQIEMRWSSELFSWEPKAHCGIELVRMPIDDVGWTPMLHLMSSAQEPWMAKDAWAAAGGGTNRARAFPCAYFLLDCCAP